MSFDIIGDIHGMIGPLKRLLTQMGYVESQGTYTHPEGRIAVFVGDLIDRGENGFDVIDIARSMTQSGNAITVMGNHELNAIFYNMRGTDNQPLRPHTKKNAEQHSAFLQQIETDDNGLQKYEDAIEWFKTLPLFYENEHFRVIHACWDEKSINIARPFLNADNSLKNVHLYSAADRGSGNTPII